MPKRERTQEKAPEVDKRQSGQAEAEGHEVGGALRPLADEGDLLY